VTIFIDRRATIAALGSFENLGQTKFSENDICHHLRVKMGIPGGFPVFKEMAIALGPFTFTITDRLLGQKFALGYQIRSPGCFKENHGFLKIGQSGQMNLKMPPN
jgi:hypothetical protein